MPQIYRIYINDALLLITHFLPPDVEKYTMINAEKVDFILLYKKLKRKRAGQQFLMLTDDPKQVMKAIKKSVLVVKAAGGLVKNEAGKILLIFRKGCWDLPKGKLDDGEKTRKAAIREVTEECGIRVDKCGKKILKTWHVYESCGQLVLKPTTWYRMKALNQPVLVPQLEEGITKAKWIGKDDFGPVRKNTYPLILDVLGLVE